MNRIVVLLWLSLLTCVSTLAVGYNGPQEAKSKYKVGQQWSYRTRPGEENSYFVVVKIDQDALIMSEPLC
jgi:hypothetical protein